MTRYADWKAPKADAENLIWPAPDRIVRSTRENFDQLQGSNISIQNVPLQKWRSQLRRDLDLDESQPIIATGHQVELYHPGVWVKNVLLDSVGRTGSATALHVAVDTDSPKHLQFRWPGGAVDASDDLLLKTGEWSGGVSPPTPQHLKKIENRINTARKDWPFEPSIDLFLEKFAKGSQGSHMLPAVLLESCGAVDRSLGLKYEARLLSPMLESAVYLGFVHQLAADIERFSQVYNDALATYRSAEGIKSPSRPMPDLLRGEETIEAPLWFDELSTGDRSRGSLVRYEGFWHLLSPQGTFKFDPRRPGEEAAAALGEFLRKENLRLAPRALTLTMFLRLCLVDEFVHGIGGGRYDQVTDAIIETYWNHPAPAFSVTTATLVFPAADQMRRECVPCVASEGHHLKHTLIEKKQYLEAITSAPRRSHARRTEYASMHRALAHAAESTDTLRQWRDRYEASLAQQAREKVLFDRELFYAWQPRDRLTGMIDRYRDAFE